VLETTTALKGSQVAASYGGLHRRLYVQGAVCKFGAAPGVPREHKGGGKRGKIKPVMSTASRIRLMHWFGGVDWDKLHDLGYRVYFVTLTTPEHRWRDKSGVAYAMKLFQEQMVYAFGAGFTWRREYGEKRGMLHYHCIVVTKCQLLGKLRREVHQRWHRCLGEPKRVRTEVEPPKTKDEWKSYMCKYVAKHCYQLEPDGGETAEAVPGERSEAGSESPLSLSKAHSSRNAKECKGARHWGHRNWGIVPQAVGVIVSDYLGEMAEQIGMRVRRDLLRCEEARLCRKIEAEVCNAMGWERGRVPREWRGELRRYQKEALRNPLAFHNRTRRKWTSAFTILTNSSTLERIWLNALDNYLPF